MSTPRSLSSRVAAEFHREMVMLGGVPHLVRRAHDDYKALVFRDEISTVLAPRFASRANEIRIESYVALVSEEFQVAEGSMPYSDAGLRTFGTHSANIPMLRTKSFVSVPKEAEEVRAMLEAYESLLRLRPRTRSALKQCIVDDNLFGVPVVHFLRSDAARARAFVDWCTA